MKSWNAQLSIAEAPDRRGSIRWRLQLIVPGGAADNFGSVQIQNLSETGMMMQTTMGLEVGESITVELLEGEKAQARIVWQRGLLYGCEFETPIAPAVIGRALLRAPVEARTTSGASIPLLEEFHVGVSPTIDELAIWKSDFERTKAPLGYKLIAFRQMSDGLMIATAARGDQKDSGSSNDAGPEEG